jgi:cystathionine beta-synthase
MQDGRLVGILDDSDIVHVLDTDEISREARFAKPVRSAMAGGARHASGQGDPGRPDPHLRPDRVAIVLDGDEFVGLITRVDLINYLRLHPEGSNSRMAAA